MFSKLNHTVTYEGHYCFKELLTSPQSDPAVLQERQSMIIKMYRSPGNVSIIRKSLSSLSSIENNVDWIWREHSKETLEYIEKLFFSFSLLNCETLLNFHTAMEVYVVPLSTIIIPILTFCVTNYLIGSHETVLQFLKTFLQTTIASYRLLLNLLINNDSVAHYGAYLVTLLYVAFYTYKMYMTFNQAYKLYCQHVMIRSYFEKVHTFATTVMDIFQQDLFVKSITQANNGVARLNQVPGALMRTIKTFDAAQFNSGYCLLLWKYRREYQKDIETLQWYVGRIDAWTSVIPLMQSIQTMQSTVDAAHDSAGHHTDAGPHDDVSFTIPQFQWQSDTTTEPFVNMKGMWHPCLHHDNIVKNDIQLGNGMQNNIILTGPNAAGKSTFLKSLTLNIYLAHTLGIACCDSIQLTPISIINTYMNIPDCIGKESLFEAEMNQSLKQLQCIDQAHQNNQFVFSVMDEIFTGTNYHEGVAGAYAVCKKLYQYPNSLNVVSTHFSFLTELEQEHPDSFKNYRMEINLPNVHVPKASGGALIDESNDAPMDVSNDAPMDEASIDEVSIDETYIDETYIDEASIDEASIDEATIEALTEAPLDGTNDYSTDDASVHDDRSNKDSIVANIVAECNLPDDIILIDAESDANGESDTDADANGDINSDKSNTAQGSISMYTYKIQTGINQHKIALDLLKGKGFPSDVVKFSNEAIRKINETSTTV